MSYDYEQLSRNPAHNNNNIIGIKPIEFVQGNYGEGFNTYARFENDPLWYSINGTEKEATEIRWCVCRPNVAQNLNTRIQ